MTTRSMVRGRRSCGQRRRLGSTDSGSVSVFVAVAAFAVLVLTGLVVDGSGKIRALQRADATAQGWCCVWECSTQHSGTLVEAMAYPPAHPTDSRRERYTVPLFRAGRCRVAG